MMSKEESGDLLENAKKCAKKEYERWEKMKGPDALNELMILDQGLDWSAGEVKWRWLTAEEICGELGIKHHIMAMGRALVNLSNDGLIKRCKMDQRTNYLLPPLRINKAIREQQEAGKVYHPDYYKRGGVEAIDVIEAWGLGFNLGNVIKYVARAGYKTSFGRKDLEKAAWYLQREIGARPKPPEERGRK